MSHSWLRCRVFKGMFSDERAIVFPLKSGVSSSAFVPKSAVRGEIDQEGKVRVEVFRDNGTIWAVLPTDDRESIPVRETDLAPA